MMNSLFSSLDFVMYAPPQTHQGCNFSLWNASFWVACPRGHQVPHVDFGYDSGALGKQANDNNGPIPSFRCSR